VAPRASQAEAHPSAPPPGPKYDRALDDAHGSGCFEILDSGAVVLARIELAIPSFLQPTPGTISLNGCPRSGRAIAAGVAAAHEAP
jgi:hypothetical protein